MRIFRHHDDILPVLKGGVVALGNFDGFHRGHQAVIRAAAAEADLLQVPLWVFSTEPHPRNYFAPDKPVFRLTPFRAKTHCLETFGVENMLVLPFDKGLASMLAQDFIMDVLVKGLGVKHAVVGYDYRFGQHRGGGVDVLRWMGAMEDFGVTIVEPIIEADRTAPVVYSSTVIRQALRDGRVRDATEALGHWWFIDGHVLDGDKRGRLLGFPTANLSMDDYILPAFGVYAVRVQLPNGMVRDGVANIGRRPTFAKADVTLEAHLFDFSGDLYGQVISVEIVDFIRPEMKFDGLDALKAQIDADCQTARTILSAPLLDRQRYALPRLERHISSSLNGLAL